MAFKEYCCYSLSEAHKKSHAHCLDGLLKVAKNAHETTALHTAVMLGNEKIVSDLLMLLDSNPNALNKDGHTPLHLACLQGQFAIATLLIDAGADVGASDQIGQNALHWLVLMPHEELNDKSEDYLCYQLECFQEILSIAPKLLAQLNSDGLSPLHLLLANDYPKIAEYLAEQHYDMSQLTSLSCENVFHLAVRSPSMNGFIEKLFTDDHYQTRLINRNMHLKPDYDGNLPIHNAAKVGNKEAITVLYMSQPSIIDSVNEENCTPLMVAITEYQLDVALHLVELGAWIEAQDERAFRAIHLACCLDKNPEALKTATTVIAAQNASSDEQLQPVTNMTNEEREAYVARVQEFQKEDMPAITAHLIARGANLNAKTELGDTPLSLASQHGSFEVVHALVERGANVNIENDMGYIPLHYACERGLPKMVTYLISKGAKVNCKSAESETPLHLAMSQDHWEIVFYLLASGADINIKTYEGFLPIHFVARAAPEKKTLVERFIAAGTDLNALTPEGDSPLDMAIASKNFNVARLIEKHGGKRGEFIRGERKAQKK